MDADVIVIGAGAAGLAATLELTRRSLRVVLLEARDRLGGRVWPLYFEDAAAPAELGAEFIHGPAKETMALLRDAGVRVVATAGDSWLCEGNAELRPANDDVMRAGGIFEQARSLEADESVDAFLRRFEKHGLSTGTIAGLRAFDEGFDAADPAIASAQAIADEWLSGVDFAAARPVGGYGPMLDRLHGDCVAAGARVFFATRVQRIAWQRGAVSVDARSAAGESRSVGARAAIVTVPIGVLRYCGDEAPVTFEPDLPEEKRRALASIEMGHVIKVTLRFRTAFWENIRGGRYQNAGLFRCPDRSFPTYWTQMPVRSRLIVAWVGGPRAIALRATTQDDLITQALSGFGGLLGEPKLARREFEAGIVHDWSRDPFARGGYSYIVIGGGKARTTLASPLDDALFFAGEATSNDGQGGTVNGALETGARAGREAAVALGAVPGGA